ncbi:MAG: glucose-1-phosphate thymidylyltransferase [Thermoguttaceae bacterium]|nr:glucose-1-phosphate thymidylyltransferase [Thermoguttaceae bacterium]MBQ6617419.1 glucose-1-phosphate thymidylyltransferase [Thermoguttaceae bacterium]
MKILLFEDDGIQQLFPATIGRAGFTLSCGGFNLIQLLSLTNYELYAQARKYVEQTTMLDVNPYLSNPVKFDFPIIDDPNEPILLVNSTLVPHIESLEILEQIIQAGRSVVVYNKSSDIAESQIHLQDNETVELLDEPKSIVAAAVVTAQQAWSLFEKKSFPKTIQNAIVKLRLPASPFKLPIFQRPHDLVKYHLTCFAENQSYRLAQGGYKEIQDGVFVAPEVKLGDYLVANSANGPIIIDRGASVGPYCYLCGPVYIGPDARIIEHAAIKDRVAVGRTTKIGGEVEGSTIEPYTNKQHHGFLGHSYVGSWVNLGAGTCNSDLKNTYGTVVMEYPDGRFQTNMQFLGCIIGDFAKTAINTSIFTGKLIGACSMLYGYVTRNVPSFVNYARAFGQITEVSLDVLIATQSRMFARRNIVQQEAHIELLKNMYEQTKHERLMANEPLQL